MAGDRGAGGQVLDQGAIHAECSRSQSEARSFDCHSRIGPDGVSGDSGYVVPVHRRVAGPETRRERVDVRQPEPLCCRTFPASLTSRVGALAQSLAHFQMSHPQIVMLSPLFGQSQAPRLRQPLLFADKLILLQIGQVRVQLPVRLLHDAQHPVEKLRPMTDAVRSTGLTSSSSRSTRAIITPWIVSGMVIVSISAVARQRPVADSCTTAPASIGVRTISSRKKGVPTAVRTSAIRPTKYGSWARTLRPGPKPHSGGIGIRSRMDKLGACAATPLSRWLARFRPERAPSTWNWSRADAPCAGPQSIEERLDDRPRQLPRRSGIPSILPRDPAEHTGDAQPALGSLAPPT